MESEYHAEIERWREAYRQRLLAERGWFRVTGLSWLAPGENRLEPSVGGEVEVAPGPPSPQGIALELAGERVRVRAPAGELLRVGERSVAEAEFTLADDGDSEPIAVGAGSAVVLRRGERFGVRLYHPDAPALRSFSGLDWFAIDPGYRVTARFEPYSEPVMVRIATILGDVREVAVPGEAVFDLAGDGLSLLPTRTDRRWMFVFRDLTSGDSTYGACRFLYAAPPVDGRLLLDFNKAVNPPCAYTVHATCPLPPAANRLGVAIPAGERLYRAASD